MATSIKQIVAQVRDYLGRPDYGRVPNHSVLLRLYHRTDYLRTSLNLTDQNWFLKSTRFTADPNEDESVLVASDWGRPILCYTVDDANPEHIRREVPITTIQNQDEYYIGTRTSVGTSIEPHVATSFALYKNAGTGAVTIRVTPAHTTSAEYELWYAPDRPTPPLLAANYPLLEQFINLTVVGAAKDLLWLILIPTNEVKIGNEVQVRMLEKRLSETEMMYMEQFEKAKNIAFIESKSERLGWDYDDGGAYW